MNTGEFKLLKSALAAIRLLLRAQQR
jgi:hypothetical protein